MIRSIWLVCVAFSLAALPMQYAPAKARVKDGPTYTVDGQLRFPQGYRDWIFLTSGFNMSYDAKDSGDGVFDNIFVNPEAYRAYQHTGHWPEGTELVLENRGAESGKSINKAGKTQTPAINGVEVHVLDSEHLEEFGPEQRSDGWSFYSFGNLVSTKRIDRPQSCYTCHEQHAAVDTTFVQFYPTLLGAAEKNKTLSASYLKDLSVK